MDLSELRTALKERREDYSLSDAKLNRKLNQAYLDICSRRKWGWLRREYLANTYPPVVINGTAGTPNFAITNDNNFMTFDSAATPLPSCSTRKRIFIDGSFYEIISVEPPTAAGVVTVWLDRRYTGGSFPTATDFGTVTIVYHEVVLPVGALTVVQAVLFDGSSSPQALDAIPPAAMAYLNKDTSGLPTKFSVIEKEPIYKPRKGVAEFNNPSAVPVSPGLFPSNAASGALTRNSTYTYWYTNYCKWSGSESALSPPQSITLSGTAVAAVFVPDIAARDDYRLRIYRSEANGTTPYLIRDMDEAALSTFIDTTSDDQLRTRGPDSASSMFLSLYPLPGGAQATGHKISKAYELYILYQMEARKLSADNDRPQFDATYTNVLLDGAELLMLGANDEQGRASHVQQRFESGIQRMITLDRLNFQQRPLMSRNARGLRGKPNSWYGSLPDYGSGGLGGF